MSDPLPPVTARRSTLLSLVLAALVFAGGAVVGGGVTMVVVGKRLQEAAQKPELMPRRMADRLERKLGLDRTQRDQVERVLERHNSEFMGIRRDSHKRMRSPLQRMTKDIERELSPEQVSSFRAHVDDLVERFLPGGLSSAAPMDRTGFKADRHRDRPRGENRMRDRDDG
jgi:hypothetical protein